MRSGVVVVFLGVQQAAVLGTPACLGIFDLLLQLRVVDLALDGGRPFLGGIGMVLPLNPKNEAVAHLFGAENTLAHA